MLLHPERRLVVSIGSIGLVDRGTVIIHARTVVAEARVIEESLVVLALLVAAQSLSAIQEET